jgi:hypothetical protein
MWIKDGYLLIGSDGKVIRELFASEQAGISIAKTFGRYDERRLEDYLFTPEQLAKAEGWCKASGSEKS